MAATLLLMVSAQTLSAVKQLFSHGQLGALNTNGPVLLDGGDVLLFSDSENKTVSYFALDVITLDAAMVWTGHSFGGMALDPTQPDALYVADHTTQTISRVVGELRTGDVTVVAVTRRLPGIPTTFFGRRTESEFSRLRCATLRPHFTRRLRVRRAVKR